MFFNIYFMDNETENTKYYKLGSNKIKEINYELWKRIESIELDIPFKEKFYLLENNMDELPKCECGKLVKFVDMRRGYRDFCSRRCMLDSDRVKESRKKTNIIRWGVDNPSKNKIIRDKVESTNISKFGKKYPLMSKEILDKTKENFLLKWGVDNPSKVNSIREKAEKTNIDRYGDRVPSKTDQIKEKTRNVFVEKFGVDNPSKLEHIRKKAKDKMVELYGVEFALQNKEILEKMKKKNLEKMGFEYVIQNPDVREKIKKTNMERYGFQYSSQFPEIKSRIKNSNIKSYDKSKIDLSNLEKFGKYHISKTEEYRKRFKVSNDTNYIEYVGDGISKFKCDGGLDHEFEVNIDNYISRTKNGIKICTICNPIGESKSISEVELYEFIKSKYSGEIIQSYRDSLEIDIYLPEIGIGFEYNGLYWHSEEHKNKDYHSKKIEFFKDRGIRVINIWEDDWKLKNEIIKSQIMNWIGLNKNVIYARNCHVSVIEDKKSVIDFLNLNHIQGYSNSDISIGLYRENEIISVMTFDKLEGRKKMGLKEWNLSRFCTQLNKRVVGGASKMIKYFIDNYSPKRIISYSDSSWSVGELYEKLGFVLVDNGRPDYKYISKGRRVHKSNFTKKKMGYVGEKTELEISEEIGLVRIWDCGKKKYEMILKEV
jgi:hypothetical protein